MKHYAAKKLLLLDALTTKRNLAMVECLALRNAIASLPRTKAGRVYKRHQEQHETLQAKLDKQKYIVRNTSFIYWKIRKIQKLMQTSEVFAGNFDLWNSYREVALARAANALNQKVA